MAALKTIYLVRHAIAADRGTRYPDDSARPLTRKGIDRMRAVVKGFESLGPGPDLILTSPLVRARQTAELLVNGLSPSPRLVVEETLAPGHPPSEVAAALEPHTSRRSVALVGHEPDLGLLAAWLIGSREPLVFKKGGIARIDVKSIPPGQDGALVWLATPAMLRGLA